MSLSPSRLELSLNLIQPACQSAPNPAATAPDRAEADFTGRLPIPRFKAGFVRAGAWCARHICCGLLATVCTPGLFGATTFQPTPVPHPGTLTPTPVPAAAPAVAPAPTPEVPAVGPADAMDAFNTARRWVSNWDVPADPPNTGPRCAGIAVTLRLLGEIVGRGVDTSGQPDSLWRATRAALREAQQRLPIDNDALAEQRRREIASEVVLSVELAAELLPLRASTYDEIDATVSPGLDAIAVRLADRTEMIFPDSMLSGRTTPGDAAASLVGRLLRDPAKGLRIDRDAQPARVSERHGLSFFRVRVLHVRQSSGQAAGLFMHRGGRVVETSELTAVALREFAEGLASHLLLRRWPGAEPFGLRGQYNPIADRFEAPIAGPAEQAMIVLALQRASRTPAISRDLALRCEEAASAIQISLAQAEKGETPPWEDAVGSLLFLATIPDGDPSPQLADAIERCLATASKDTPLAIGALLPLSSRLTSPDQARATLDAVYASSPEGALAQHMPWAVLGERRLAPDALPTQQRDLLRAFRDKAYAFALPADAVGEDGRDLVGGFVFPGARSPMPTAQSARVVAGLAAILRDRSLTPDAELATELVRILPTVRFLRQLAGDDAHAGLFRNPANARFGIRSSPFDQSMPGEASALTLMALCDLLDAVDRLRDAAAKPPAGDSAKHLE